ncbi:MAG: hypothetical protein AAFX03_09070 [Pseudomonadota bacterium]
MAQAGAPIIGFLAAFLLSTLVIRGLIPKLQASQTETKSADAEARLQDLLAGRLPESASNKIFDLRSTGFWIGFCETFLIFVLIFAEAFSALAIIIGAKQFVRNEKIQENPSYYLLGTLANLSIAILFALVAQSVFEPMLFG